MECKILIVGSGEKAKILAQKLGGETYISSKEDIRDDDLTGLLKFAFEKNINITVPISKKAIESDIVSFFQANGQNIFGPTKQACYFMNNKTTQRKFLYKLHAPIAKFNTFNKPQLIQDYINCANYPIIIYNSENSDERYVCTTIKYAQNCIDDMLYKGVNEFLAEEFTYGENFSIYFITDGYSILPITTLHNFKKDFDYSNIGCFAPNYKISENILTKIQNFAEKMLLTLDNKGNTYSGIIGIEAILENEENFIIHDIKPFFSTTDIEAVLNLVQENLSEVFLSCINGSFSDEYDEILTTDMYSISTTVNKKIYTQTSRTLSRAKECLKDELSENNINTKGIYILNQ